MLDVFSLHALSHSHLCFFFSHTKQGPKPSPGPHKQRECLPLLLLLRNRLKYALTYKEAKQILMQRLIKVDGKVRTEPKYPAGFMGKLFFCEPPSKFCPFPSNIKRHHCDREDQPALPSFVRSQGSLYPAPHSRG